MFRPFGVRGPSESRTASGGRVTASWMAAVATCLECPVGEPCLAEALATGEVMATTRRSTVAGLTRTAGDTGRSRCDRRRCTVNMPVARSVFIVGQERGPVSDHVGRLDVDEHVRLSLGLHVMGALQEDQAQLVDMHLERTALRSPPAHSNSRSWMHCDALRSSYAMAAFPVVTAAVSGATPATSTRTFRHPAWMAKLSLGSIGEPASPSANEVVEIADAQGRERPRD